jgi:hypothetical protein
VRSQVGNQSKIQKNHSPILVDQHVFWLEVAVKFSGNMQSRVALALLCENVADLVKIQGFSAGLTLRVGRGSCSICGRDCLSGEVLVAHRQSGFTGPGEKGFG